MRHRALKPLKPPATGALIFVCKKCDGSFSRELARALRDSTKERYGGKHVRVATTSCMKLCPKKAVALAVVPVAPGAARFFEVREAELDAAVEEICARIETPT